MRQTKHPRVEYVNNSRNHEVGYNYAAREFLRSKLIGKHVRVAIDFVKPEENNFPERTGATVYLNDT